ncbi:MAG TPA: hypothetical protein VMV49_10190, partial [Candidatus Deferrimicrobium sp.]|nr:hypothetical protein [Candidatus Deferrimicrobium sp.]
ATIEDVINTKVTGLVDGKRTYEIPLCIKGKWDYDRLTGLAPAIKEFARVFFELGAKPDGKYDVVIRSINSIDARTASVTNLSTDLLYHLKDLLLTIPLTKTVFFDVTPKPPATIEYV